MEGETAGVCRGPAFGPGWRPDACPRGQRPPVRNKKNQIRILPASSPPPPGMPALQTSTSFSKRTLASPPPPPPPPPVILLLFLLLLLRLLALPPHPHPSPSPSPFLLVLILFPSLSPVLLLIVNQLHLLLFLLTPARSSYLNLSNRKVEAQFSAASSNQDHWHSVNPAPSIPPNKRTSSDIPNKVA
eukprot:9482679-Pyramimonas_sp.AAC.1